MNKKLSMKSIQTFGGENPFLRSPSTSSRSNHPPVPFQPHYTHNNHGNSSPPHKTSSIVSQYQDKSSFKSPSHKPIFKSDHTRLSKEYQMSSKYGNFDRNKSPLKIKDFNCEEIIFLLKHEKENLSRVKETV